ncbi:hypothetical protein [Brucella tritici]|uniref:Uncharacterized protein n=1 Tax=Brucella tritici TaxID=94626 RepID=A0A6L3YN51_9HYPH|nr:hypothetical protein [Brucella tritici]KAB2684350.1 hypothetical protein F9L08_13725 [Brucella tritici]
MSHSLFVRAAPIATSMTVDGPEAIDRHPPGSPLRVRNGVVFRAGTEWKAAGRDFVDARGMAAQPAGEESLEGRCRGKIENPCKRGRPSVRPVTSRTQLDVAFVETGMKTGVAVVSVIPEAWRLVANEPPDFQTGYAKDLNPGEEPHP